MPFTVFLGSPFPLDGQDGCGGVGLGISLSPGQSGTDGVSAGWALGNSFSLQAGLVQKSRLPLCPGWPLSPPHAMAEGIFL